MIGRVRQRKKRARGVVIGMNLVNLVQEKPRRPSPVHEPLKGRKDRGKQSLYPPTTGHFGFVGQGHGGGSQQQR